MYFHWDPSFSFFSVSQFAIYLPKGIRNWFGTRQQPSLYTFFFFNLKCVVFFIFSSKIGSLLLLFLLLFSVNLCEISEVCIYLPNFYYSCIFCFLKVFLTQRYCFSWTEAVVCQQALWNMWSVVAFSFCAVIYVAIPSPIYRE